MKNSPLLLLIFTLFSPALPAQHRQVVAPAGGTAILSNNIVSWTIGEPLTETFSNQHGFLTQGFHQGKYRVTSIFEPKNPALRFTLFPNPAKDQINLQAIETQNLPYGLKLRLFDAQGKKLLQKPLEATHTQIGLAAYAKGIYFLHVFSEKTGLLQNFKIVKTAE